MLTRLLFFFHIVYHIHDQPVPSDGNCTGTKAHQDPYIRGEKPPCYPVDPASCQVGDLAGKHGNITGSSFSTAYVPSPPFFLPSYLPFPRPPQNHKPNSNIPPSSFLDLYLSTVQGPASFFGNRSIVIHTSNTTRLTCANFTLVAGNSTTNTTNTTTPVSPTLTPFTGGAASTTIVSVGAILAGIAAFLL